MLRPLYPADTGPTPCNLTDQEVHQVMTTLNQKTLTGPIPEMTLKAHRTDMDSSAICLSYCIERGTQVEEFCLVQLDPLFNISCVIGGATYLVPGLSTPLTSLIAGLVDRYEKNGRRLPVNPRFETVQPSVIMRNGLSRLR